MRSVIYEVNRLKSVICVGFFCLRLSSLMSISNALETSAVQSAYLQMRAY